jgi:hypothetical protein
MKCLFVLMNLSIYKLKIFGNPWTYNKHHKV